MDISATNAPTVPKGAVGNLFYFLLAFYKKIVIILSMKSTELKRVVSFANQAAFNKGISLILGDVDYEYSGYVHAINFYNEIQFSIAYRRFENAGMINGNNFTVHA